MPSSSPLCCQNPSLCRMRMEQAMEAPLEQDEGAPSRKTLMKTSSLLATCSDHEEIAMAFCCCRAGSCLPLFCIQLSSFLVFQLPHILKSRLRPWLEHEKMAPSHRLTRCFCMNRGVSFKGTGLVVAFLPVYALRQGTRRYMAEKFILTHAHTHTHEMSYEMFQGLIATTGTG